MLVIVALNDEKKMIKGSCLLFKECLVVVCFSCPFKRTQFIKVDKTSVLIASVSYVFGMQIKDELKCN